MEKRILSKILLIILLIGIIILVFIFFDWFKEISKEEWFRALLSIITIILLFFYTFYTSKMVKLSKEKIEEDNRPFLFCGLISGKKYYTNEQIEKNNNLLFDTHCVVKNLTKYNLNVLVDIKLKMNGKDLTLKDSYRGIKPWPVSSFLEIKGHFNLYDDLIDGTSDIFKREMENPIKNLNMELNISYFDVDKKNKKFKNPTQYWHFNFEENLWVSDEIGVRA